ncbi:MAG: hypothetical protein WC205_04025 [Opitutaceae bacterium]|jgi:hypothetical protein
MSRSLFTFVGFFSATLLSATPTVPLVNLVDDQTLVAVSVTDAPALLRGWDASPLATTWNDPQVVKFLAPLREKLKVEEWDADAKAATGLTVREVFSLAEGEVLIALPTMDLTKLEADKAMPPVVLALELGSHQAKLEKIIADSRAKNPESEETEIFSGVTVHNEVSKPKTTAESEAADEDAPAAAPRRISWAIVDGVWVLCPDKQRVFAFIDALKQGGLPNALGKSERFLRTRQRTGEAQGLTYVNFPAIYPLLRDLSMAAKEKSKAEGKPSPMGVDADAIVNALGLDAVGEIYFALHTDTQATRLDAGFVYTEERGLLKLLAYLPGPAAQPEWVPAKWVSVSTSRFSMVKAYAGLEELLDGISPVLSGLAQGQIRAFNKKLGLDLKRDLIGSLGDDLVSSYAVPPGLEPGSVPAWTEMDQFFALSLADEETFTKCVEALKKLAGPAAAQMFTEREYLGNKLYTLNVPARPDAKPVRGFTYAIANRTFLIGIGSPATVENALQGMASGDGGFWKREDVKAALVDLPPEAGSVQVQDIRVIMASIVQTAVQMQEAKNAGKDDEDKENWVDVSARPDAEVIARHWSLSSGYGVRTPDGLFSTWRLMHPAQ